MWWSSLSKVMFGYKKIRPFLPSILADLTEGMMYPKFLTKRQTEGLLRLGESIGLEKKEIVAATNIPIDNIRYIERSRATLFGLFVTILLIICIVLGLSLLQIYGDPLPGRPTYTPGTKYGSISPNDFGNGV